MMTIQHIENTTVYAYEGRDGSMAYDIEGGPDAMATAIRHIVPVWPVPFKADVIHECDACSEHDACMTVNDEAFCEMCFRSLRRGFAARR